MAFFDFLFGGKDKIKKFDQFTPEQNQALQQLMQMLSPQGQLGQGYQQSLSGLQEMMDPSSEAMQRFADPYMQQFEQQTVPGLAERFAGAGATGGALSSSGFGQALGAAGGQLQTQLAGMKSGLQQQAMRDIMGQYGSMLGQGMGAQPFGYMQQKGSQGLIPSAIQGYAEAGFPGMGSGLGRLGRRMSNLWSNYAQ